MMKFFGRLRLIPLLSMRRFHSSPPSSAFPSLRNVDFLRYVVGIRDFSEYENAVYDGKPLETFAIRYFNDFVEPWSKQNDLNMRSLMMSFGGAYSSGLLSNNVIVRQYSLFGYSTTRDDTWPRFSSYCFSSYCASWDAYNEPGERRECMCRYISSVFPLKMVALNFGTGISGCLPFEECIEIVLKRRGGRELLLSPDYILSQCDNLLCGVADMVECYATAGLRPHVTMADIERYCPEEYDPSWLANKYHKQDNSGESDNSNDDRSEHSNETYGSPSDDDDDDDNEDVYLPPRYLRRRRMLSERLANFLKALQVAQSSNVEGASVWL